MNVLERLKIDRGPNAGLEQFKIEMGHDGRVATTSYWRTVGAREGMYYLQWSPAGAHLLVPRLCLSDTLDMMLCKEVVISSGCMPEFVDRGEVYEVMFDDGSDAPFAIHMDADDFSSKDSIDRSQWAPEHGSNLTIEVVPEVGVDRFTKICRYREVDLLPSRAPWPEGV